MSTKLEHMPNKSRSRAKKRRSSFVILLLGLGVMSLLCVCGLLILPILLPTAVDQQDAPVVQNQPTPVSTKGILPGLQAADIKISLEDQGFICTQADKFETANVYNWTCQQEADSYSFRVDVYGETLTTVDYVSATALNFGNADDEFLATGLGFIATVPYDGAEPEQARAWVEKNFQGAQTHEATFGEVQYSLSGQSKARILTIGVFKW